MAFLGSGNTLEDVLGQQATQAANQTKDQYSQYRKRLVGQQAASGRLGSGVSDYPLTDLDTSEAGALGGIQSNLASTLAGIPSEDWLNQNNFNRSYGLVNQISGLNKPSTLDEIFRGIGTFGKIGGTAAAFA